LLHFCYMCPSKFPLTKPSVSTTCAMKGEATQALERSLRRQRSETATDDSQGALFESAFSFDQVFDAMPSGQEEIFPSICWPMDSPLTLSEVPQIVGLQRSQNGRSMKRSRCCRQGLSILGDTSLPLDDFARASLLRGSKRIQVVFPNSRTDIPYFFNKGLNRSHTAFGQ
jgi:hypothetical protein